MAGTKTKKTFVDPLDPFERGLEAMRSIGDHAKKGVKTETEETAKTFLEQVLGVPKNGKNAHTEKKPHHADAAQEQQQSHDTGGHVEIFNFMHHQKTAAEKPTVEKAHAKAEAAIDYHREITKSREKISKNEMHEMRQNIEQIKAELAKLVASSQILKLQFAEVGVEQTTHNVGTYHLNLFEWMLGVIRSARQQVEDSSAWLGTAQGKGAKRDYWSMFKQHGTTFGLSGERTAATSVG